MNCERCAANPAKLKFTELREGESRTLWICEECARELGFGAEPESAGTGEGDPPPSPEPPGAADPPLQKLVLGVLGVSASLAGAEEHAAVRCPGCGITGAELRERTLLGCPTCYETFARPLDDLVLRLHGALDHQGRLPGGRTAVAPDVESLHRELREAIEREDFEAAARLRDRLRRVRGRRK